MLNDGQRNFDGFSAHSFDGFSGAAKPNTFGLIFSRIVIGPNKIHIEIFLSTKIHIIGILIFNHNFGHCNKTIRF